eukprot:TRINITY_DN81119_c0_g1_i1.p1 TRINITY_DN81119_c0_g1~~TRINITY_DN81119_c0_g1_i1.p1  ORF type:complete len:111 (-),score=32.48 TRINITY_DN81119_c0_g1_i1:387-719(-)
MGQSCSYKRELKELRALHRMHFRFKPREDIGKSDSSSMMKKSVSSMEMLPTLDDGRKADGFVGLKEVDFVDEKEWSDEELVTEEQYFRLRKSSHVYNQSRTSVAPIEKKF